MPSAIERFRGVEPFRGSEAVAGGLLTPGELRGPRFRRLFPDVYLSTDVPADLHARARAAALLVGWRGGVVAGWAATELLVAHCAPRDAPVDLLVDFNVRAQPGLRIRRGVARPDEVRERDDCRVTSFLRTAYDLGRWVELADAVVAVDALAARAGFAPVDVLGLRERYPRAWGSSRLDRVVELADPAAESAMETRLRLILVLGGLPAPRVQYPVVDGGQPLGRVDLAYPDAAVGIEYDADGQRETFRADRRRDVAMAAAGWTILRFTSPDVLTTPDQTLAQVRAVLAHRAARPT
jgi:very-short-patch-repair endonuclease